MNADLKPRAVQRQGLYYLTESLQQPHIAPFNIPRLLMRKLKLFCPGPNSYMATKKKKKKVPGFKPRQSDFQDLILNSRIVASDESQWRSEREDGDESHFAGSFTYTDSLSNLN